MICNLSWAEATSCDERLTTITSLEEKKKWFINLLPRKYKLHARKIRKSSGILSTRTNPTISKPLEVTRGWTCCRIGEPQGAKLRESVWREIMMLLGWKFSDELDAWSSSCQEEKIRKRTRCEWRSRLELEKCMDDLDAKIKEP